MSVHCFHTLSPDEQVRKLDLLARKALAHWDIADAELCLIKYRENCVYSVFEPRSGDRFALRIHRPAYHCDAALNSELIWMQALLAAGVATPEVKRTTQGKCFVTVQVDQVPEPRVCDLLGWLEGEALGSIEGGEVESLDQMVANYRLAGETMACIHNQASEWKLPEGFVRPVMDEEGLVGKNGYLGDFRSHPDLTPELRELLDGAAVMVCRDLMCFGKTPDRFSLSHADFLPENLLVKDDAMCILDFDDCGFGWHMMDVATAVHFLRDTEVYDIAFENLVKGYRSKRSLPEEHLSLLPAFSLARSLSYVAWTATRHETETARQLSGEWIQNAVNLAVAYLNGREQS